MRIRIPHCKIRFLIFVIYNLFYVLYMMGKMSQIYYLVMMLLFCVANALVLFIKKNHNYKGKREFKLGITYISVFFLISAFIQCINFDFQQYLISGLIRIGLPIINAFLFVNSVDSKDQVAFFNVLFARFILHFVWQNVPNVNLKSFLSISWENSYSDFESTLAHDFIIMEMYYLYKQEKKKSLVCMILCMLSMKRISFVLAPILYIFSKKVPIGRDVRQQLLATAKIVAIISPFIVIFIYSSAFQNWFLKMFHVSLNIVMSGRPRIYEIMRDNMPYKNGYGSINNYLANFVMYQYGTKWNAILHNDFLRILYETTIVGVIVLANNLVETAKKEYWFYLMISYLFLEAITSHIFNYFSVWVTYYMIVMSYDNSRNSTIVQR